MVSEAILSELGVAELARLLSAEAGFSVAELRVLMGYPLDTQTEQEIAQEISDQRVALPEPADSELDTTRHLSGFKPRYWQIISVSKNDTRAQLQSVTSAYQIQQDNDADPVSRIQASLPELKLRSDTTRWQRARQFALVPSAPAESQVKNWLKALERAETPKKHSAEQCLTESGDVWLVLDLHWRLMVWWDDINNIGDLLYRKFGCSRATLISMEQDSVGWDRQLWPTEHTRIVLISDLGALSDIGIQQQWQMLINEWHEQGAEVIAFTPTALKRAYPLNSVTQQAWEVSGGKTETVVEDLLACLSMVQWCSVSLLRTWRRALKGGLEDEYRIWNHVSVKRQPGACCLLADRELYRSRFIDLPKALQTQLIASIQPCRPQAVADVLMEEALIRRSLRIMEESKAFQWLDELTARESRSAVLDEDTVAWLWRLSERQDRRFWQAFPHLEKLCLRARKQVYKGSDSFPLGPGMLRAEDHSDTESQHYELLINGTELRFRNAKSVVDKVGLQLLSLPSDGGDVEWRQFEVDDDPGSIIKPGKVLKPLPSRKAHWRFDTGLSTTEIAQIECPPWATAIEQTPEGLYCSLPEARRLRWCYPGELSIFAFDPLTGNESKESAAWIDEIQLYRFKKTGLFPYMPGDGWESKSSSVLTGEDIHGRYAGLVVGNRAYKFRWIPPGEFMMGSPKDEPERGDDETRHKVIITQGFWLAETACTQALWQEVMGENPSHFKGDDLPVEEVSWDDVQKFCQRLNERLPGLEARLPGEAEWEYACRAGTETAFWWGSELSTDVANYNGNQPYNNGPKGEYREKTLPVRTFEPNPWGLYQMHGNVYEWCEDRYGDYPEGESVDPNGPEAGGWRVHRGGGWGGSGWRLRAASRLLSTPDDRYYNLGFRLALGPRPGGAPETSDQDGRSESERSERHGGQRGRSSGKQ